MGRYGCSRPARSDKWRWLVDPYGKAWPMQARMGGLPYRGSPEKNCFNSPASASNVVVVRWRVLNRRGIVRISRSLSGFSILCSSFRQLGDLQWLGVLLNSRVGNNWFEMLTSGRLKKECLRSVKRTRIYMLRTTQACL